MALAFKNGIMPDIFWRMTPWQLKFLIKASIEEKSEKHDQWAWFMWHLAVLTRWGGKTKFPELQKFQSQNLKDRKNAVAGPNEDAILAWLMACKAKFQSKEGNHKI